MPFFVLGSHPALSLAEIATVLGAKKDYSKHSKEILLLDDIEQSPEVLQDRLAGIIKIGDIIGEIESIDKEEVAGLLVSSLSQIPLHRVLPPPLTLPHCGSEGGRIAFGISVYSLDARRDLATEVRQIGMTVKKKLKEEGRTARFVSSKTTALSSAAVTGEKLLENGAEFVFIVSKEKIYIGQTRTVQDFRSWSKRDYGRPRRDAKSGMLPPKLARMMINLAASQNDGRGTQNFVSLLDPFCGSGTVLMEAALMGFQKIIGNDVSEKAIKNTKINLEWLSQNEGVDISLIRFFNKPVETLASDLKEKIDAIVTETYLGPPLSGRETPTRMEQIINELTNRTATTLTAIHGLLKKDGIAVLALPAFQNKKNIQYLPTKKLAEAVGLQIIPFTSELGGVSPNSGLLYVREGQRTGREIVKLWLK